MILLADDEHAMREALGQFLHRAGFDVLEASTGELGASPPERPQRAVAYRRISVDGYTDSIGSTSYNLGLSPGAPPLCSEL